MPDKKILLDKLIGNLKKELELAEAAANGTRDLATAADLKSEGKYDTRAIEASYLAGAQLKRVEELKLDIQMLEDIELESSQKLQLGSLAKIEYNNVSRFYFLTSTSGGTILDVDGESVLVISVFSPLGSEALGLSKGDTFEVETPKEIRSYKILEIN